MLQLSRWLHLLALALATAGCDGQRNQEQPAREARAEEHEPPIRELDAWEPPEITLLDPPLRASDFPGTFTSEGRDAWEERVPGIRQVRIPSSEDEHVQPALFYEPDAEGARPLLVVLHSWSVGHLQHLDIPFAQFARDNGWVFIHPHFRGANDNPEATASDLAVQDVVDAARFAAEHANVDPTRVYLTGFSGGGMMALVVAARVPQPWTAVAAWVPIYDLAAWHDHHEARGTKYAGDIRASCGGEPREGTDAGEACLHRSPRGHLTAARDIPVKFYLAHGVADDLVPPSHAVRAFNDLVPAEARVAGEHIDHIDRHGALPEALGGEARDDPDFEAANAPVVLHREAGGTKLVLFEGEHDMLYNPGLRWLNAQRRPQGEGGESRDAKSGNRRPRGGTP
jgi:poly(3-hydroxybutyrate) depolymerase